MERWEKGLEKQEETHLSHSLLHKLGAFSSWRLVHGSLDAYNDVLPAGFLLGRPPRASPSRLGPLLLLYPWFEDVAIPVEGPLSEDEGDGRQREGGRRRKGEKGCGGRRLSARAGRRGGGATPMVSSEGGRRGVAARVGRVWALAQQPRDQDWERSARGDWAKAFSTRDRSTQPINTRREPHQLLDGKNDREVKSDLTAGKDPTAQTL